MLNVDLTEILRACAEVEHLPRRERHQMIRTWRRTFAQALHEVVGKWTWYGMEWHAFTYATVPCLEGDEALKKYRTLAGETRRYLVLSAASEDDFAYQCAGRLPDLSSARSDVLIVPNDFSWTMAFTHETAFGPFLVHAATVAQQE